MFTRRRLLLSLAQDTPDIRVLLVTGGHDHPPSFYSIFHQQPGLRVNVDPHPAAFTRDFRSRYDVLVLYDMIRSLEPARQAHLRAFVESGKGVVILHHAICSHVDWPWWHEEVAGALYLPPKHAKGPESKFLHDVDLTVEPAGSHPIIQGLSRFTIRDETYKGLWFSPKIRILLKTSHPTSDGPVAWIGPSSQSRVAAIQLGHDHTSHEHPIYRKLVHQAIRWSAGRLA